MRIALLGITEEAHVVFLNLLGERSLGMRKSLIGILVAMIGLCLIPMLVYGQAVLGPCTDEAVAARKQGKASAAEQIVPPTASCMSSRVPLPGEPAIDFQLPAVVGNEIKTVKLSDYQGKYRVLCFFPADFTFV